MNILIDIGHPAHVHLFKNVAYTLQERGHTLLFTARDKEHELYLLKTYKLRYRSMGRHFKSKVGKMFGLIKFNVQLFFLALKFKPDLFLSHGSMYAAQVSWLFGKPHISLEDTGNIEQIRLYRPFTEVILSPSTFKKELGPKQIHYNSYHELAYLHPNHFSPNYGIIETLGLQRGEKYAILRFVSWQASHDRGQCGLSNGQKKEIIHELTAQMKVFISSEKKLPPDLEKYKITIPPDQLHHALAFAYLVVSEGATVASEAGLLGTPAIYVNTIVSSVNEEQEEYGLLYNFRDGRGIVEKVRELTAIPNLKELWAGKRDKLVTQKIDTAKYLVDFVESYCEAHPPGKAKH